MGRNSSIVHRNSSGTVLTQESYAFDPVGNMSSKTVNGLPEAYSYDDGDVMLKAGTTSYTYDLACRMATVTGYSDNHSPNNSATSSYSGRVPSYGKGVGRWHTHPPLRKIVGDADGVHEGELLPFDFSQPDLDIYDGLGGYDSNGRHVDAQGSIGYVGTPDGRIHKYVPGKKPGTGKKTVIGWWNR